MAAFESSNGRLNPTQIWRVTLHGAVLAVLCAVSYLLTTHLLVRAMSVSKDDDLLGGMWAVVATIFVFREGRDTTIKAASSRLWATFASMILCSAYLSLLPFSLAGMVGLIGVEAIALPLLGLPDEVVTTAITTAVVMVVAALSPQPGWKEPILRLVDTIIGVGFGVTGVWLTPQKSSFGAGE